MPSKSTLAIVTCLAFGSAVMSLPLVNSESYDLAERDYTDALDARMFEMDLEDLEARQHVGHGASHHHHPHRWQRLGHAYGWKHGRHGRHGRHRHHHHHPHSQHEHHGQHHGGHSKAPAAAAAAAPTDLAPAAADAPSGADASGGAPEDAAAASAEAPLSARQLDPGFPLDLADLRNKMSGGSASTGKIPPGPKDLDPQGVKERARGRRVIHPVKPKILLPEPIPAAIVKTPTGGSGKPQVQLPEPAPAAKKRPTGQGDPRIRAITGKWQGLKPQIRQPEPGPAATVKTPTGGSGNPQVQLPEPAPAAKKRPTGQGNPKVRRIRGHKGRRTSLGRKKSSASHEAEALASAAYEQPQPEYDTSGVGASELAARDLSESSEPATKAVKSNATNSEPKETSTATSSASASSAKETHKKHHLSRHHLEYQEEKDFEEHSRHRNHNHVEEEKVAKEHSHHHHHHQHSGDRHGKDKVHAHHRHHRHHSSKPTETATETATTSLAAPTASE